MTAQEVSHITVLIRKKNSYSQWKIIVLQWTDSGSPKYVHFLISGTWECYFIWKKGPCRCDKIRIWNEEIILVYMGWGLNAIISVFIRERPRRIEHMNRRTRWEDGSDGAMDWGTPRRAGSQEELEEQGTGSASEPLKADQPHQHLIFRPLAFRLVGE